MLIQWGIHNSLNFTVFIKFHHHAANTFIQHNWMHGLWNCATRKTFYYTYLLAQIHSFITKLYLRMGWLDTLDMRLLSSMFTMVMKTRYFFWCKISLTNIFFRLYLFNAVNTKVILLHFSFHLNHNIQFSMHSRSCAWFFHQICCSHICITP